MFSLILLKIMGVLNFDVKINNLETLPPRMLCVKCLVEFNPVVLEKKMEM